MRSHFFRDYGLSLLGLGLAVAAMTILSAHPAKPTEASRGFALHQPASIVEMAAMQPGTDAGSFVGDRAQTVGKPGDLKSGGPRSETGGDVPKAKAVDARKQSSLPIDVPWPAHLKPS